MAMVDRRQDPAHDWTPDELEAWAYDRRAQEPYEDFDLMIATMGLGPTLERSCPIPAAFNVGACSECCTSWSAMQCVAGVQNVPGTIWKGSSSRPSVCQSLG
ncbi:hypothetical protein GCM10023214_12000 [Amycolatopsis dongchuanensis]|uniref:Uncharacterized protein n=1 Tax=Amycolatopsis dongchuanensis TaxID=1070866 RepID=A0ABP9Q240_9PSEU